MDENDDYDKIRQRNIAERDAMFAEFFEDLKKQKDEFREAEKKRRQKDNLENEPPKKRRRASAPDKEFSIPRYTRWETRRKYFTRSRTKASTYEELDDSDKDEEFPVSKGNRSKIQVLFPWAKSAQREIDLMKMDVCDSDEEEKNEYRVKRTIRKAEYNPSTIPSVDNITDEMLANVAEKSSSKTYCKTNGTSCHQCRQKTLDTKTVCRSGECIGVRGQFCGPCLRGRYGENAVDALKDPNWACPPCRGLCNCSLCRTRSGLPPTGILAPIVQVEGYSSVMEYLQSAEADIV